MKFFAVFAAILAVACGYQATWSLHELSEILANPTTDPALIPHFEHALNELMDQIYAGHPATPVTVSVPALDVSTWSLQQLSDAIEDPNTDPELLPYLINALNQLMVSIHEGHVMPVIAAEITPAMDVTAWSLQELSDALVNPETNSALVPYLEHALNELMSALMEGHQVTTIAIATPVGLLPVAPVVIPEEAVVPAPAPVEEVVVPAPSPVEEVVVPASPAPASPLVQIIVNVNAQASGVAPSPVIAPEIVADKPEPIIVVDQVQKPEPINVVDQIQPEPVIVGSPIVAPSPVAVVEEAHKPEPVIVGSPILAPTPVVVSPGVNPVDVLHPLPVVAPVVVGGPVV